MLLPAGLSRDGTTAGVAPDLGESVPALLVLALVLGLVLGSPACTSGSERKIEDESEDEDEIKDEHGQPRGGGAQHPGPDSAAAGDLGQVCTPYRSAAGMGRPRRRFAAGRVACAGMHTLPKREHASSRAPPLRGQHVIPSEARRTASAVEGSRWGAGGAHRLAATGAGHEVRRRCRGSARSLSNEIPRLRSATRHSARDDNRCPRTCGRRLALRGRAACEPLVEGVHHPCSQRASVC